jgi:hypothetical protein
MDILRKEALEGRRISSCLNIKPNSTDIENDDLVDMALLLRIRAGLVTVDEESNTVRLVHYTLQEYMKTIHEKLFPNAELGIAKACLAYLAFDVFKSGPCGNEQTLDDRLQKYPFLYYASHNWGHHVRDGDLQSELMDIILRLLEDDQRTEWGISQLADLLADS